MSFVRRSLFQVAIILLGMAISPRFDWAAFFHAHGLDPDCEPRFPLTEFDVVDGRAGWQWLVSIRGYLDWRSGRDWMNWRQRKQFADDIDYYVTAINFLNSVIHDFGDAIPRKLASTPPLAIETPKKKPSSVRAAKSAKAGAR